MVLKLRATKTTKEYQQKGQQRNNKKGINGAFCKVKTLNIRKDIGDCNKKREAYQPKSEFDLF